MSVIDSLGAPDSGSQEDTRSHPLSSAATLKVALGVLAMYVIFVVVLIALRQDRNWDRLIYLLSGFEAIVFSAIGWIFGTTVARGAVQEAKVSQAEAKEQASTARQEAAEARTSEQAARAERDDSLKDAERGRAIAASIKAKTGGSSRVGARPEDTSTSPELEELRHLAERLFPD